MKKLLLLLCLLASPVLADMYPDASNAKLPEAKINLGIQISAKDLGFVNDGTTVNTAAIAALFARTDSPTIYFPAGTYLMPCPTTMLHAASPFSIIGESKTATKWIYPAGCTGLVGVGGYSFYGSNWRIEHLTIDFNGAASSAPTTTQWAIFTVLGSVSKAEDWRVSNVNFINTGTSLTPFSVVGHIYGTRGWSFDHNLIHQTAPNTYARGGGLQVNESGAIHEDVKITNNVFQNIGMSLAVRNSIISNNDISGTASGGSIVTEAGVNGIASGNLISNNNIHDGAVTRDVFATASTGIENHGSYNLITGNLFSRNGGGGVINFGRGTVVSDNTAIDNVRVQDAGPSAAFENAYVSSTQSGDGAVFVNNTAIDTGATQFAVITGTATAADQLKLTFTGAITGSPVTVTYIATGGASLTAMAAGLAAVVNGNAALTAANINATSVLGVVTINQPPQLGAAITSSVTGAATETVEVLGSQRYCYAEPNTAVLGAATVYLGKCVPGKGGGMVRDIGIQPGTRIVPPPDTVTAGAYYARAYGSCIWDATHDVAPCINQAIAAAAAAGGGTVNLPAGTYGISSTVAVTTSKIGLRCNHTVLKWLGAAGGRMMSVASPYGDPSKFRLTGNSVKGCEFQGNGAADGLYLASLTEWEIAQLRFFGPFNGGSILSFDVVPAAPWTEFGEPIDIQDGFAHGLLVDGRWGTSTGIYLGNHVRASGSQGNASLFWIDDFTVFGNGVGTTAIHSKGADTIYVGLGQIFNTDGIGVDLDIAEFSVLTTTGNTTSGSAALTGMASTSGLLPNAQNISGAGIPNGTYIVSVDSSTAVTLSQPATATASGTSVQVRAIFASAAWSFAHLLSANAPVIARGQTTYPWCAAYQTPPAVGSCTHHNKIARFDGGTVPFPTVELGAHLQWANTGGLQVGMGFSAGGGPTSPATNIPATWGVGGLSLQNLCYTAALKNSYNLAGSYLCPADGQLSQYDSLSGDRYVWQFGGAGPGGNFDLLLLRPEGTGSFYVQPNLWANGGLRANLPVSCAGQPAGTLWNNAGVVNICP